MTDRSAPPSTLSSDEVAELLAWMEEVSVDENWCEVPCGTLPSCICESRMKRVKEIIANAASPSTALSNNAAAQGESKGPQGCPAENVLGENREPPATAAPSTGATPDKEQDIQEVVDYLMVVRPDAEVRRAVMEREVRQLVERHASTPSARVPSEPIAWAVQWEYEGDHGTVRGMHLFDTEERARYNHKDVGGKLVPLYEAPSPETRSPGTVKFSSINDPRSWETSDFGIIEFATHADALRAEELFNRLSAQAEGGTK